MIGNNILIGADFVAHLMEDVIVHPYYGEVAMLYPHP